MRICTQYKALSAMGLGWEQDVRLTEKSSWTQYGSKKHRRQDCTQNHANAADFLKAIHLWPEMKTIEIHKQLIW